MILEVKLDAYEGPLDLLLTLIEKNKIDIYNIPIVEITNQYLEAVQALECRDMEITSQFMVMAATLIDIKCRMLLPVEEEETEETADPREELVQRLLDYKKFKYISGVLREKMEDAGVVYPREKDIPPEVLKYRPPVDTKELLSNVTLENLMKLYEDILKRFDDRVDKERSTFGKIEREKLSIGDTMMKVQRRILKQRKVTFRSLLEAEHDRTGIVVTFLAILELIHYDKISVTQTESFGEIIIESKEPEDAEVLPFDNIDLEMG